MRPPESDKAKKTWDERVSNLDSSRACSFWSGFRHGLIPRPYCAPIRAHLWTLSSLSAVFDDVFSPSLKYRSFLHCVTVTNSLPRVRQPPSLHLTTFVLSTLDNHPLIRMLKARVSFSPPISLINIPHQFSWPPNQGFLLTEEPVVRLYPTHCLTHPSFQSLLNPLVQPQD